VVAKDAFSRDSLRRSACGANAQHTRSAGAIRGGQGPRPAGTSPRCLRSGKAVIGTLRSARLVSLTGQMSPTACGASNGCLRSMGDEMVRAPFALPLCAA
jgi:hypothetical protein